MTLAEMVGLTLSLAAVTISGLTAWLTLFKRGQIAMTQPTTIYFGPDGGRHEDGPHIKIYLRTLLYSTSRRGRIIESMFLRLSRGESSQNFNVWVYGEQQLKRGSGLFVPEDGITANHHFLLPFDGSSFKFLPGQYKAELYASLLGTRRGPKLLRTVHLEVSPTESVALDSPPNGLYFDWGPDSGRYYSHIRRPREQDWIERLEEFIQDSHPPNSS